MIEKCFVTNMTACIKEFEALARTPRMLTKPILSGIERLNNFESLCVLGDIKRTL